MEQPVINPYAFYFLGVFVVAVVAAIQLIEEYIDYGHANMTNGRIARYFFAIFFSWFSCITPLSLLLGFGLCKLYELDFWKRKPKSIKIFK